MSHVADIILITMIDDGGAEDTHPNTDKLAGYLKTKHQATLVKVDEHWRKSRAHYGTYRCVHGNGGVRAPYSEIDLLDDEWAPTDDRHAEEIDAGLVS